VSLGWVRESVGLSKWRVPLLGVGALVCAISIWMSCSASSRTEATNSEPSSPGAYDAASARSAPVHDAMFASPAPSTIDASTSIQARPRRRPRPPLKGWSCTRVHYSDNSTVPYLVYCFRTWESCEIERVRFGQSKHTSTPCEDRDKAFCVRVREWPSEREEPVCSTTLEECRDHARLIEASDKFDLVHDCILRD
jgi:hypothetical protein